MRSKADISQLSLIYLTEPTTKKRKTEKVKKVKKQIRSEVSVNSPGNSWSQSGCYEVTTLWRYTNCSLLLLLLLLLLFIPQVVKIPGVKNYKS